jgi:maleate cis-trans isomerase
MHETQKEYIVGTVRPTNRPESGQEIDLDEKIPAKIKLLTRTMNFTRGTEEEFSTSMPGYEAKAAELAKMNADLVRPSGAPPFMLLGYKGEQEIISGWEKKYGVQMFTSGQNHVRALRTLGIKSSSAPAIFRKDEHHLCPLFHRGGLQVLPWKVDAPFADVPKVAPEQIFEFVKSIAPSTKTRMESTCSALHGNARHHRSVGKNDGLPVVHAGPARCWETQLRLGLRHPMPGYGRLLAEVPSVEWILAEARKKVK